MAVVKRKVCRRESQRSIALSGKLKKDGDETVNSAALAAYLNESMHRMALQLRFIAVGELWRWALLSKMK